MNLELLTFRTASAQSSIHQSVDPSTERSTEPWTYSKLDEFQRQIALRVLAGGRGALICSEVSPVVTLGKRACAEDLLLPEEILKKKGVELYRCDRGGRATYHGPGQWVIFLVDTLERLTGDSRGVRKAVDFLTELALDLCHVYDPEAQIHTGDRLGIWSRRGAKLASIGVQVKDRVLLHGIAINYFRTPESFFGIKPCGLDAQPDFLFELGELGTEEALEAFKKVPTMVSEWIFDRSRNHVQKSVIEAC